MKARQCSCGVVMWRVKKIWICPVCDLRPVQQSKVSILVDKFKDYQKGFMKQACEPELKQLALRANQLRRYQAEKAFGAALKSGNIEKLMAMIEKLQQDLRGM